MSENSPRYSNGASGFGSNVSKWDGPPSIQIRIQRFAFAVGPFPACFDSATTRRLSTKPVPSSAPSPSCNEFRRVNPSHRGRFLIRHFLKKFPTASVASLKLVLKYKLSRIHHSPCKIFNHLSADRAFSGKLFRHQGRLSRCRFASEDQSIQF